MDFIDLSAQQRRIKEQLDRNIQKILTHGQYILAKFEIFPEEVELRQKAATRYGELLKENASLTPPYAQTGFQCV